MGCAPSAVRTKFTWCGLCGENLPIGITRCIVMVHHRRPNGIDRRHGCYIIRDDEKCAIKQYQVVENGKSFRGGIFAISGVRLVHRTKRGRTGDVLFELCARHVLGPAHQFVVHARRAKPLSLSITTLPYALQPHRLLSTLPLPA